MQHDAIDAIFLYLGQCYAGTSVSILWPTLGIGYVP
jgi:hypothetical protein